MSHKWLNQNHKFILNMNLFQMIIKNNNKTLIKYKTYFKIKI
jgi:hypothetical protein